MFTESERRIFKYNNGKRPDACADPMMINTRLLRAALDSGKDIDVLFKQVASGFEATDNRALLGDESLIEIVGFAHKAFGTTPLDEDGNGLTVEECVANLNSLMEFMTDAKKNGDGTPLESSATDGPQEDSEPLDSEEPESPSDTKTGSDSN